MLRAIVGLNWACSVSRLPLLQGSWWKWIACRTLAIYLLATLGLVRGDGAAGLGRRLEARVRGDILTQQHPRKEPTQEDRYGSHPGPDTPGRRGRGMG